MSKIIIFLLSITTLLIAEDKMLWDLGIVIKSKEYENNNIIKPLISNTQIMPSYKKIEKTDFLSISELSIKPKHIIKLLSLNNEYFKLIEYVKNMENQSDELNDQHLFIYADALYQINNYNDAIKNINLLSDNYPIDEKYFILALYNKKAGNTEITKDILNKLINEYPKSEYIKLAKLQTQRLK